MSLSNNLKSLLVNRVIPREQRGEQHPSHDAPLPDGASNENPPDIGLLELLVEDFHTHESSPSTPGFWAIAVHRLGNARMDVHSKLLRTPLTLAYHLAFTGVNWLWGIDLSYTVKLGRRVRIWHHGGTVLGARSIGDDVHIRHNTTLGLASRFEHTKKPIIGNRVDIGAGAAILGAVTVADDCVIGANSVVLRDLPPGSTAFGVPARPVNLAANGSGNAANAAAPGNATAAAARRAESESSGEGSVVRVRGSR
jgi:serine O-acetyltransferase